MDELESKKNQAIQDVLSAVKEQIQKDGIRAGDMHFNKIKYIERDENGAIKISYPMTKGTYHNCCYIIIEPNGNVHIHGVQTSPERRDGVTRTGNGSFDINLNIENWSETENITEVTEKGYGKYQPNLGIFESEVIAPVKVDPAKMYEGIGEKYNFKDEEDYQTYGWEGCALPYIPCIQRFENGSEVLVMSPKHAVELLKAAQDKDYRDILIYTDCYGSGDCYDIALGDVELYVMDTEGIKEQENSQTTMEYEEYKSTILECLKSGIRFDYNGVISKELSEDKDFIEKANEILKENPNNTNVRKLKRLLGLTTPLTYNLGAEATFKKAIVDMTKAEASLNTDSISDTVREIKDATIDQSERNSNTR